MRQGVLGRPHADLLAHVLAMEMSSELHGFQDFHPSYSTLGHLPARSCLERRSARPYHPSMQAYDRLQQLKAV